MDKPKLAGHGPRIAFPSGFAGPRTSYAGSCFAGLRASYAARIALVER